MSIKNNKIIVYPSMLTGCRRHNYIHYEMDDDGKKTYKGILSGSAVTLIRSRIELFSKCCDFFNMYLRNTDSDYCKRLTMITLTLSGTQHHTDEEIKRLMLRPFLQTLLRADGLTNWIWKAERQKNGNIHFHIVIDKYLSNKYIQDHWNSYQIKYGYLDNYYAIHRHYNAPSTDIHCVLNSSKTVRYISKYLCKNNMNSKISGAVWRCSSSLLKMKYFSYPLDNEMYEKLQCYDNCKLCDTFPSKYFCVYQFKSENVESVLTDFYAAQYKKYFVSQAMNLFQPAPGNEEVIQEENIFIEKVKYEMFEQLEVFPLKCCQLRN